MNHPGKTAYDESVEALERLIDARHPFLPK